MRRCFVFASLVALACDPEPIEDLGGDAAPAADAAIDAGVALDANDDAAIDASEDAALDAGEEDAAIDAGEEDAAIDAGAPPAIERVSVSSTGEEGNREISGTPFLDFEGRFVAFGSAATNLVADDTNQTIDVFVRDRSLVTTEIVSISSTGVLGDQGGHPTDISADGRYIVLHSESSNLSANDTNMSLDVFVADRLTGMLTLESMDSNGVQAFYNTFGGSISDDGRYVTFDCLDPLDPHDTNDKYDVYLRDRLTGEVKRVSIDANGVESDARSTGGRISGDGNSVVFASLASNLVPDDTNGVVDVFVWDRVSASLARISISSSGEEANDESTEGVAISGDGRYVAFTSQATNLVPDDDNFVRDIFVYDRSTAGMTRESVNSSGVQGNGDSAFPSISEDGRYVSFTSHSSNFVDDDWNFDNDVFRRDRQSGITTRVGAGEIAFSDSGSLSGNGRFLGFTSSAPNLVPDDMNGVADGFIADVDALPPHASILTCANVTTSGVLGNGASTGAHLSANGRIVAFTTQATNFDAADANNKSDVVVRDLDTGVAERASISSNGAEGNDDSTAVALSGDGRYVLLSSRATNLVANDTNGADDLFVHDRVSGETTRASVDSTGVEGNAATTSGLISDDGMYIVLSSEASNLDAEDTNGVNDVFVREVATGATVRVSIDSNSAQLSAPSYPLAIYGSGRFAVFVSSANVFVRDRQLGITALLGAAGAQDAVAASETGHFVFESDDAVYREDGALVSHGWAAPANGPSRTPGISADGLYAVLESRASNLIFGSTWQTVPGNAFFGAYVCDAWGHAPPPVSGACIPLSLSADGSDASADVERTTVSADGRFIAFDSAAGNLPACNGGPFIALNPFLR